MSSSLYVLWSTKTDEWQLDTALGLALRLAVEE